MISFAVRQGPLGGLIPDFLTHTHTYTYALTGALAAEGAHWLHGEGQEGVRERGRGVSAEKHF